jgi:hypothetical protein
METVFDVLSNQGIAVAVVFFLMVMTPVAGKSLYSLCEKAIQAFSKFSDNITAALNRNSSVVERNTRVIMLLASKVGSRKLTEKLTEEVCNVNDTTSA